MNITDVRVRMINAEGKLKAVASVTFDEEFVVHDIKVIESLNGLFIAMPSRKTPDGEYKDIAHPINTGMRERLQTAVIERYESMQSEEGSGGAEDDEDDEDAQGADGVEDADDD